MLLALNVEIKSFPGALLALKPAGSLGLKRKLASSISYRMPSCKFRQGRLKQRSPHWLIFFDADFDGDE